MSEKAEVKKNRHDHAIAVEDGKRQPSNESRAVAPGNSGGKAPATGLPFWQAGFLAALVFLATIAFLYLARPVLIPVVLAWVAGMALKPVMRWLTRCRVPPKLGAAIVLVVIIFVAGFGFVRLSQPAMDWVRDAPQQMMQLRGRLQTIFRPAARISQVANEVSALRNTEDGQPKAVPVEVKDNHTATSVLNWTSGVVIRIGEALVLLYLLLASGDLFLQKIVRMLPARQDKRQAVEITHEIQQKISHYLFSVSLINAGLGVVVGMGLYFMGVPNPGMWGVLAAFLNYVPYFGPITGIILLGIVGLLNFDTLPRELLPPAWYLGVHLIESNLITPILLGKRFTLNPVIIFISLMFWTWLWGVTGALLSVPILMSMKSLFERVPVLSPISELMES